MGKQGSAGERPILLRNARPDARAAPGGDHQNSEFHQSLMLSARDRSGAFVPFFLSHVKFS
jgi:hypothetical protein